MRNADSAHRVIHALLRAAVDNDPRAFPRERAGDRQAYAGSRAGNQCGLALEL